MSTDPANVALPPSNPSDDDVSDAESQPKGDVSAPASEPTQTAEQTDMSREKRHSKLTEKAEAAYMDSKQQLESKLDKVWQLVRDQIVSLQECDNEVVVIQNSMSVLRAQFAKYCIVQEEISSLHIRANTAISLREQGKLMNIGQHREEFVKKTLSEARTRCQELTETSSITSSRKSGSSVTISSVSSARRARLEKEATKLEEERRKMEAIAKRQLEEVEIEAQRQKEKARVLERKAAEEAENSRKRADLRIDLETLAEPCNDADSQSLLSALPQTSKADMVREFVRNQDEGKLEKSQDTQDSSPAGNHAIQGWVQHFLKRDLVSNGLEKFDDTPENFLSWQLSFKNVVNGAQLSPREELDLLVKWSGTQSAELVKKIRAVHVNRPSVGLKTAWERLEENFGKPEVVSISLITKVRNTRKMGKTDHRALRDFGDALSMLEYAKEDSSLPGLEYLDTFMGINPLADKLPDDLQDKWRSRAHRYKQTNGKFPPFMVFSKFVREYALERSDQSFAVRLTEQPPPRPSTFKVTGRHNVNVHKTEVAKGAQCPIHKEANHAAAKCRALLSKSPNERREIVKKSGFCLRCVATTSHKARDCKVELKCSKCGSERHQEILHTDVKRTLTPAEQGHGGEKRFQEVRTSCTEVCGTSVQSKSCAKICLANIYHKDRPATVVRAYIVMDDQSNRSLAKSQLFKRLGINSEPVDFSLTTCSGKSQIAGQRAQGLVVESISGSTKIALPTILECNNIPDNRNEIPGPRVAAHHAHLRSLEAHIPEVDPEADILLLLGRDVPQAHKIRESRNGPNDAPWAQRLDLGWVILGEVCTGRVHRTPKVNVYRTNVTENGRPTIFQPCTRRMTVTERYGGNHVQGQYRDNIGKGIFVRTDADNEIGPSIEDREFVQLMMEEMRREETGHLIAPLPFKSVRNTLPNNKERAHKRLSSLSRSLTKNEELKEHYTRFMSTMLEKGHAEPAPPLSPGQEVWYLPHFGVYHPKKPGKIRIVFDSSDKFNGYSLNDVLLTGPDLLNNLLGVLLRFRSDSVACMADIEQMFYSFYVEEEHRDFLRFLWFENNDPGGKITEYRMKVHIFGNSPSPAVATFGLRKTAQEGQDQYGKDAKEFVEKNFYCDDGLLAVPTVEKAINILKQTKSMLAVSNLRLHKIASNSKEVMEAFPASERATDICDLDLDLDEAPLQRSLGILWNLQRDAFTFQVALNEKPYTKRGVLSVINSIYDPLGFVQPVVIGGKVLLREMTQNQEIGWDDQLPDHLAPAWHLWRQSLLALAEIEVPRAFTPVPSTEASRRELHVFSDASQQAIAAVAYLKVIDYKGNIHVSFLMGKAKLAPKHATSIPRLELNASVLAVELKDAITNEIDLEIHEQRFYSDSRVVLGYVTNRTKRFYVYVANRVERILRSTSPEQWIYVPTNINPADHATRPVTAEGLPATSWLQGPDFLKTTKELKPSANSDNTFFVSDKDVEVKPDAKAYATSVHSDKSPMHLHFTRFSSWNVLVRSVARLIRVSRCMKTGSCPMRGIWHACPLEVQDFKAAEKMILHNAQAELYSKEICALEQDRVLPIASSLAPLNPYLDDDGLLRVGGRLKNADIPDKEKNPYIIPGDSHIASLLIRHHHEKIQHQGRHFTEGAVRKDGLWIVGAKRKINSLIHKCVTCRKLRGRFEQQQMADLPVERLEQQPPFTNVGIDVFGPWEVVARRTRGGHANSKRWAVIFTCLSTRAVHIEVIESMTASCFINALRRFFAIRGPAKKIRSDCGTNFVGAVKEMEHYLQVQGCEWEFNPPHASHMGGSWERMIGLARRILSSMLLQPGRTSLTHEILTTLMAEVSAIINARPLVPVTTDAEAPAMLTPSMLLNQKICGKDDMGDFTDVALHRQQWKRVQALADQFWARWRKEYLTTLQPRKKWSRPSPNLKLGDIVLLKDNMAKRNQWPLGIVTNTFPSQDGLVRRVEVKTGQSKKYLRPVTDIVVIVESQEEIEE